VKGYKLLYTTLDTLFIQRSVKFEEGPSHVLLEKSTPLSLSPLVAELWENSSDQIYDQIFEYDISNIFYQKQEVAGLEHQPRWAQQTLEATSDLVGDLVDPRRTRSLFVEPPQDFTTMDPLLPIYCYLDHILSLMQRLNETSIGRKL
jgi:hypothetical protein